ncbi:Scr1 family TA system antitoxin-like transcriptional regulator [Actinomadura chokoriensis]|uniref:Scr1 family TA system antitoxin-like transcriptional regulator n=1 Tax=Actinomadura chokoriensis TaxID=454156 RepID=UPI0031F8E01E
MSRLNWYRISSPGVAATALAINSEAIRTASSEKRGLTGTRVGEIINCVRSHVANLEAGRACIDMKQAKALDVAWGTGGHFERLLFFARSLHSPDWFRQGVEYEMKARILRICQGQTIPVALQSEDYARAVLSMARVADLDKALMERMARQELIIGREDHPLVMVLLEQDALDRPTGGAQVMKAQLQRLLELAVLGSGTRRTRTVCGSS